jgi:hypothetical protein
VAARLQAAAGADGDLAVDADLPIQSQAGSLASLCEAAGFQRKDGHDRERIVKLEKINVVGSNSGHCIGAAGGVMGRLEK